MQDEIAFNIDFNLHQVPAALGLPVPPAAAAAMLGISEAEFLAYVAEVEAAVAVQAAALLEREPVRGRLAALRDSLPDGGRVLAIGDSITTYRRGYIALLSALLAQCYPDARLQVLNAGQSGYTSTHARECTYTQLLALQPDLVTVMFGANDCKRFGRPAPRTLVSVREYGENLEAIVEAFLTYTGARIVLFTPAPVVEPVVNSLPDFAAMRMAWDNADLAACGEAARTIASRYGLPCVDLQATFGPAPGPALYLPDGLHPGPAGHVLILERLLATFSQERNG